MLHNTQTAYCIRLSKTLTAIHTGNRLSHFFPYYMGGLFYYSLTAVPFLLDIATYGGSGTNDASLGNEKNYYAGEKKGKY